MSKRYSGALITKTPVVPTSLSAPGVWSLSDQAAAQATNTWPFPRDPQFNYVTMLLHGDGSAGGVAATGVGAGVSSTVTNFNADASTNNFNVAINGDAKSNNFTPYQGEGYYSNSFDGSTGYLSMASNAALNFGTGDATVEFWFNASYATLLYPGIFSSIDYNSAGSASIRYNNTGYANKVFMYINTGGDPVISSTSTITFGVWAHVAFVRQGTSLKLYLNGVLDTTVTISSGLGFNLSNGGTRIGRGFDVDSTNGYFTGYLSNLRAVKGTAVYTSNFTPSTTPLTAITNTSLLTCQSNRFIDNSTNAFTLTVNGSPQVSPAQPFTLPSSVATYGSGYFDGTGDYLTAPSNSAFAFGTGDFTVECWAYFTSVANFPTLTDSRATTSSTTGFNLGLSTAKVQLYTTSQLLIGSTTLVANTWYHIAVTRSGTTLKIWLNGVQDATVSNSTNWSDTTLLLGATPTPTNYMTGYMTDTRLVKGTAVYSATFTPPTTPLTAITNTSLLTTQYNGGGNNSGFKDSSQFNFPITRNGNTTQGTFTPYGSNWSNYFDGSSAYWKQASSTNYTFGTSDFTIELWINLNSTSTQMRRIIGVGYGANGGSHGCTWDIRYQGTESPTGQIMFGRYDGSTETNFTTSGATITVGTWTHIAISRTGGNLRIFVDGVAYYSAANSTNYTAITYGGNTEFWAGLGYYGPAGGLGGPRYFGGYMSNIRIINGTGIYSSTFTPSTTPLTAITNTQLLTAQSNRFVDNSSNAQAITLSGSPSVQRFSPFAPLTVYNPATYGGSAYFDGSGDYLNLASNSAFNIGTNSFCIEFWVYTSSFPSGLTAVGLVSASYNTNVHVLGFNTTGIRFYIVNSYVDSTTAINLNAWNHVACVRNGTTATVYINGVASGTGTLSGTGANSALYIGTSSHATGETMTGYLSNVRFVNGSAVYTSNFTPNAPLTAIANTSFLLSGTNPAILDNSMLNNLETVGNAAVSTSVKKYGAASIAFDGTGDYLLLQGGPNFTFGTGDFTIEMWIYVVSGLSADIVYYDGRPTSTNGLYNIIYTNSTGKLIYNTNSADRITGTTTLSTGTWYHIAVCRSGTSTKLFLSGAQEGSTYTDSNSYIVGANRPVIGGNGYTLGNAPLNGYIDDLRITKYARYTTTFTVPDQAFPNG